MRKLLHIDTAGETGMVCLSMDGKLIHIIRSEHQKEHASFLHDAIQQVLQYTATQIQELEAVVVTEGPGSYTGLRVGLSSAKGLCFALNIPLICLNGLELLAHASAELYNGDYVYWPMIDARRDEVFTATYDKNLSVVNPPHALILSNTLLNDIVKEEVIFCGSGSRKLKNFITVDDLRINTDTSIENSHCKMGFNKLEKNLFADLLYAEPLYIKEFYENKGK